MNKHITQKIMEEVAKENDITVKMVVEIISHYNSELRRHCSNIVKGVYITKILLTPFLIIKLKRASAYSLFPNNPDDSAYQKHILEENFNKKDEA
jgi:hypothetical protein